MLLCYKLRKDLSIISEAIESLSLEISYKKSSNLIFNAIFRPPTGGIKVFEQFCEDIFSKNQNMKHMMFAGDFNMNVLYYEYNRRVKGFFDFRYQRNLIPTITKPTRVGKNSATAIDHTITDYVLTCDFKTAILKTKLMIDNLSNIQKLKISTNVATMKKISKLSITDYFQSIGMKLKTALIPMRLIGRFLIYLTQFLIYISQRF